MRGPRGGGKLGLRPSPSAGGPTAASRPAPSLGTCASSPRALHPFAAGLWVSGATVPRWRSKTRTISSTGRPLVFLLSLFPVGARRARPKDERLTEPGNRQDRRFCTSRLASDISGLPCSPCVKAEWPMLAIAYCATINRIEDVAFLPVTLPGACLRDRSGAGAAPPGAGMAGRQQA